MKIRKGFVTNSSSSSFIVAYDSEDEMKNISLEYRNRIIEDIMNPENQITVQQALDYFEECCYCSICWEVLEKLREEMGFGYDHYDEWQKWKETHQEEVEKKEKEEVQKQIEELKTNIENKKIISMISYSDDTSDEEAVLEQYCYDMDGCYAVLSFH